MFSYVLNGSKHLFAHINIFNDDDNESLIPSVCKQIHNTRNEGNLLFPCKFCL